MNVDIVLSLKTVYNNQESMENKITALLQKADSLLYQNIDKEVENLENSGCVDEMTVQKYEKLKEMYQEILECDPDNEKAHYGLKACNDMLDVHHPVQHLGPGPPLDGGKKWNHFISI